VSTDRHGPRVVVVDVVGSADDGVAAIEAGAAATLDLDLDIALVGDAARITATLRDLPHDAERLQVVHAPDAIALGGSVVDGLADAPRSSMRVALELVARQPNAAFVTAGHPGAVVELALRVLDRVPNVPRAAMAAVVPTLRHRGAHQDPFALLLDIGATVRCDGAALDGFARMGAAYASAISTNPRPTVALLSTRSSPEASPAAIREADRRLRAMGGAFEYLGLMTADRVPSGDADVVVTDGTSGQLYVRTLEGIAASAEQLLLQAQQRFAWRLGVSMLGAGIDRLRVLTNWEHYGGAPLLGVDRTVIVTQPGARRMPVINAIRLAAKVERLGVLDRVRDAVVASDA
jgi:phosphate acyltransferase